MALKKMQCELCGSIDIMKVAPDVFQCQHCGCKYTLEQAKTLISGTVEITKGQAELERLLGNAEAQIRFNAYEKAEEIYKDLTNEYPGEHKVWVKYHECLRSKLMSGHCMLHSSLLWTMKAVSRNAKISAPDDAVRQQFADEEGYFWEQLAAADFAAPAPMINYVQIVRFLYKCVVLDGGKVYEWINKTIWDYIVVHVINDINKGKLQLYTYGKDSGTNPEKGLLNFFAANDSEVPSGVNGVFSAVRLSIYANPVNNYYNALMNLEKLHPMFAEMIETGRKNASAINGAKARIVYAEGKKHSYMLLPNGMEEVKDRYVTVYWHYGDYTFGTVPTPQNLFYIKQNGGSLHIVNISREFKEVTETHTLKADIDEWNNNTYRCPFCGTDNISDSIFFGRKCKKCQRPFSRIK